MLLQVETTVNAPIDHVWNVLVDWESQSKWMMDARDVEVVSDIREGNGVTIHVPTLVLGVPVLDIMRITGWDPPHRLEATHLGKVVKGVGAFEMTSRTPDITDVVWWEEIVAPFGRLGEFGANMALPVLRAVFNRSLRKLRETVESTSPADVVDVAGTSSQTPAHSKPSADDPGDQAASAAADSVVSDGVVSDRGDAAERDQ